MSLHFKQHSFTVASKDQQTKTSRSGQITPASAANAFQQFGIELTRPHMLLDDSDGFALYEEGGRVTWGSRTFAIKAKQTFDGIGAADHTQVYLDEVIS